MTSVVDLNDLLLLLLYLTVLFTVLGNIAVIVAILSQERTRRVRSNKFLISLACADLCVGVCVMLPSVLKTQAGAWTWGSTLCKVWVTLDVLFCSASIYSLIGISLDRFYAIYWPVSYAMCKRSQLTNGMIVLAWTVAVAIAMPMYLNVKQFSSWTRSVEKNSRVCAPPTEPSSVGYALYAGSVAFILPTIILTTLYLAIGYQLHKRQSVKVKRALTKVSMVSKVDLHQHSSARDLRGREATAAGQTEQLFIRVAPPHPSPSGGTSEEADITTGAGLQEEAGLELTDTTTAGLDGLQGHHHLRNFVFFLTTILTIFPHKLKVLILSYGYK